MTVRPVEQPCPDCKHVWLWHGTAKGCTKIVRVNGSPFCGCKTPPPWKADEKEDLA